VTQTVAVCVRRIIFGDGWGGMERAAAEHVESLLEAGLGVCLLTPVKNMIGTPPEGAEIVDVPWPRWNNGPGSATYGIAYNLWIRRLVKTYQHHHGVLPVLLHLHGGTAHVIRGIRKSGLDVPCVVNPHGMEEFSGLTLRNAPNRVLIRHLVRTARLADCVIATDTAMIAPVRRNIAIDAARILVIPNSVDPVRLQALGVGATPTEGYSIVTVGRLAPNKGYDLLRSALERSDVRECLPIGTRWLHFGDGTERTALERSSRGAAIPLEVRSHRSDAEVQHALSVADLFVQPSRYEGSSLTTLEAMAHGRVIVATKVGGIPDKIIDGITGFLAEPTMEGIGDAIVRARSSTMQTGPNAQQLLVDSFSKERSLALYLDLYRSLAR